MMNDWVRSKPWLALVGVISAGLSLLSVFGLLSALGVRAVPQVGLVPFLILGEYSVTGEVWWGGGVAWVLRSVRFKRASGLDSSTLFGGITWSGCAF